MAYTVDYLNLIVTIPKADLTVIDAGNEVYELNILDFWAQIHDLQDDPDGMAFPAIMDSTPPTTLGGDTYARVVRIVNGWRIQFEDGQYQVNFTGANTDIASNRVQNQVSLNTANSAGLVQSALLDQISVLVDELHKLQGLSSGNPMTVTETSRTVADINLTISGDGVTTTTVTRT